MRVLSSDYPTPAAIWRALVAVGEALDRDFCIRCGAAYDFWGGHGRTIRLTPESAARWRLELLEAGSVSRTTWALDERSLVQRVREMRDAVHPVLAAY